MGPEMKAVMLEDRSSQLEKLKGRARKAVREAYLFSPNAYSHAGMQYLNQFLGELEDNFHVEPKLGRRKPRE